MHPTYHQKYFDNFDFRAINNTWAVTKIYLQNYESGERQRKDSEWKKTYFLLIWQLSGDIFPFYVFCLAPNKALDYYIKSHISLFSAL